MKDDRFERYQAMRSQAVAEAREGVINWMLLEAPETMTLAHVRSLADFIGRQINHHTRQVFEMATAKIPDQSK